jgi:LmbE family N-acetylglucosaminyl deacetylase
MVNQSDHIAVGQALVDAARDAGNRWVFRELLTEGHEPWNGVKSVAIVGSPQARHGVDVSGYVETGIASLAEHSTYLDSMGDGAVPWEDLTRFLRDRVRAVGVRLGCEYAVPFEVLSF